MNPFCFLGSPSLWIGAQLSIILHLIATYGYILYLPFSVWVASLSGDKTKILGNKLYQDNHWILEFSEEFSAQACELQT